MNREQTIAILGIIKTAYPRFYANMKKQEAETAIALWQEMFSDIDAMTVTLAVKSLISHLEFPPTIADVRNEIMKMTHKEQPVDYWNEAYKMICNGTYMTLEEFNKHSDICRRYFGSLDGLRSKSTSENFNVEVEQALFNKTADSLVKQQKQDMMLPESMKQQLASLTSNLKMIGD